MAYQLRSTLFTKDAAILARLQRIAEQDSSHVEEFNEEDCVSTIQQALFLLVPNVSLPNSELAGRFGTKTGDAVQKFKREGTLNGTGKKILRSGQVDCDRIVGIQTIEALDRMLLKKQPAAPVAPKIKKRRDVIIWIQGAGVDQHGQVDSANAGMLKALVEQTLNPRKAEYEKSFLFPPLVISFFGAPRSGGLNPESKIRAAVKAIPKDGTSAVGRIFIWGSSIGGINAMHLSSGLKADGFSQELIGLGDAAFGFFEHSIEEKSPDGRTIKIFDKPGGMNASLMSSTFQTQGNELTTFFGFIAELHGAVRGVPRHDVSNNPRIKGQMDKFIAAGSPSSRKNSLWLSMHDSAVSLGEEKFKFDLVGLLIKL